ncbi:MAG: cobyric acid synthase, partial [bacterium]
PYLHGLHLDAEDAVNANQILDRSRSTLKVVVPVFSRISNHTDFDALRLHPLVDLQFVGPEQTIPPADLIILPGSKNVRMDLQWLRDQGWEQAIQKHLRYGGKLLGICGGFQMLGDRVADDLGIEGEAGKTRGLALLEMETALRPDKILRQVSGQLFLETPVSGYEIHCGVSRGEALNNPAVLLDDGREDGAVSADGQILGTYLHGLFDSPQALEAMLNWAGLAADNESGVSSDISAMREAQLNRLADTLEQHLSLDRLFDPAVFRRRERA